MKDPLQRVVPHLRKVQPYVPGIQPEGSGWIKLNTNELPYPPSPKVAPAIEEELGRLALYPNPTSQPLRQAIAKRYNLNGDQVIIGNGSDDLLNLLMRSFGGEQQAVLQTVPSYSLYPVLAAISDGKVESVEFDASMQLPLDKLSGCKANILFLTSPNAPTGVAFPLEQLRTLAKGFDGILVIDEAYADFAVENALPLLGECSNVIITRTFSKSYGLAGLRVGFAMADAAIIRILDSIRDSYNVNRISQAGALAAFEDASYYEEIIQRIIKTRQRASEILQQRGWKCYPSQTNFIFAAPPRGLMAAEGFEHLKHNRILVRHFPSHPLTADYLRISIGTDEQMNSLLEVLQSWENQE
jgi:histidinol-phosphate aminotransferase